MLYIGKVSGLLNAIKKLRDRYGNISLIELKRATLN
jgi:hypothetical protein